MRPLKSGEFLVLQDAWLDRGHFHCQLLVAGVAVAAEQRLAQGREGLPVGGQSRHGRDGALGFRRAIAVDVALGDAAVHMGMQVVTAFRLAGVDVAGQVEVEVVLRVGQFVERHHAGVARDLPIFIESLLVEGVDNAVDVLFAQAVLVAVFDEALGGVDHEDALAGWRVFLVQHQDARGDAGAVEQVGRQADDAFQVA